MANKKHYVLYDLYDITSFNCRILFILIILDTLCIGIF